MSTLNVRTIAAACIATLCVALVLVLNSKVFCPFPPPTGQFHVGTRIFDIVDDSHRDEKDPSLKRSLGVQTWFPTNAASGPHARYMRWSEITPSIAHGALIRTNSIANATIAEGKFPVLIFGHKWGGRRTQNTSLFEELASHGYIVVSIDHPYVAARIKLHDGRVIRLQGSLDDSKDTAQQLATWNGMLKQWVADDTLALDQIQKVFPASADMTRVGAFGHSFGGAAALALCGNDPRVSAALNLDGWTFDGLQKRTDAQKLLILYEATLADANRAKSEMDRIDESIVRRSLHQFGGDAISIAGTQHADFTDEPLLPPLRPRSYIGPIRAARIDQLLRSTTLHFFDHALKGTDAQVLTEPEFTSIYKP